MIHINDETYKKLAKQVIREVQYQTKELEIDTDQNDLQIAIKGKFLQCFDTKEIEGSNIICFAVSENCTTNSTDFNPEVLMELVSSLNY